MVEHEIPLAAIRRSGPRGALEALLLRRRSIRTFSARPVSLAALASLVWAAQGRTTDGHRVCPSAHALYPLALSVVAGSVDGLAAGAYRYDAEHDRLRSIAPGDHREAVARTTLVDAEWLRHAPVLLLLSGDIGTAEQHFAEQPPVGRRGQRYVWLEAGHAGQNIYLRATEIGLGAVLVAGFHDDRLRNLDPRVVPAGHHPLAIVGLGHPEPGPRPPS